MAKCYTLESPENPIYSSKKPKVQIINNILNFSKALEVVNSKINKVEIVLN